MHHEGRDSPEMELLRELAGLRRAPQVRALADRVNFDLLHRELRRQRMLPLLGSRLLTVCEETIPAAFAEHVHGAITHGRAAATHNELTTWALLEVLEACGICAMPLKGPFLSRRLHGDAALRVSRDIDILVHAADLTRAVAVLLDTGCSLLRPGTAVPRLHHILLAGDLAVELHWRIHWYETSYSDSMLARSHVVGGVRAPTASDELLSLLLFHARDGLTGLRSPADLAAWWTIHDASDREPEIRQTIADHPAIGQPCAAAALSTERVLGIPLSRLTKIGLRRRSRLAVDATDWRLSRSPRDADVAIKLVDGLLTTPRGMPAFFRRSVLPRLPGSGLDRLLRQCAHATALCWRGLLLFPRLFTEPGSGRQPTADR